MTRAAISLIFLAFIGAGLAQSNPAKPRYEPPNKPVGDVQTELAKLNGSTWILESIEINGRKVEEVAFEKVKIEGNLWKLFSLHGNEFVYSLTPFSSGELHCLDFRIVHQVIKREGRFILAKKSIFKLEDDRLIIGQHLNPEKDVPDSFLKSAMKITFKREFNRR